MFLRRATAIAMLFTCATDVSARSIPQKIDGIFGRWTKDSPGCVVGVAEKGKSQLVKAYGMANLESRATNGADTIFDAGSTSKQFTAFAIALLARDGKLSLDDPVQRYLPELPDYGSPLTIRHLLHHTSGLRDWDYIIYLKGVARFRHPYRNSDVLTISARQKALNFTPGSNFSYSNTNYDLAALIVERVSGMKFPQFTRERIFGPLGMTNTSWRDDHTRIIRGRAQAYTLGGDGYHLSMPLHETVGAGGLLTTVRDLLKWNDNFIRPIVGDSALLAEMITPSVLPGGIEHHYAFGISIGRHMGSPVLSHGGATGGYRSALLRYPNQQLSVALLCNAGYNEVERDARQVAEVVLGRSLKSDSAPLKSPPSHRKFAGMDQPPDNSVHALQELLGTYASSEVEQTITVTLEEGALVARFGSGLTLPLQGAYRDAFRSFAGPVIFRRGEDMKVNAVSIGNERTWDVRFQRLPQ
jgi:CubicO group peptidase (beta-lactamase class C family)